MPTPLPTLPPPRPTRAERMARDRVDVLRGIVAVLALLGSALLLCTRVGEPDTGTVATP